MIKIVKAQYPDDCTACGEKMAVRDLILQHHSQGYRLHLCPDCLNLLSQKVGEALAKAEQGTEARPDAAHIMVWLEVRGSTRRAVTAAVDAFTRLLKRPGQVVEVTGSVREVKDGQEK